MGRARCATRTPSSSSTPPTAPAPCATRPRTSTSCAPGIAIYGLDPFGEDPALRDLEPALELRSYVGAVKPVAPGESVGYGRRFVAREPTHVATLPIGYGDGVRRALTNNADVLVRGARRPLVGTVSMDNVTVDVGTPPAAAVGDEAVLVGAPGRRAHHGRGARAAPRHDQLRDHLRAAAARAARAPPRRRRRDRPCRDDPRGARRPRRLARRRRRPRPAARAPDRPISTSSSTATSARPPSASRARCAVRRSSSPTSSARGASWPRTASWHADLSPLRGGSLAADLALRDFTVNAMAQPLDGGELVDPHGGAADLAARRLRAVGPRTFADDPLRAVRLVRLAAELELEPEPRTCDLAREQAARVAEVAQERVFAELKRILAADGVTRSLRRMDALGVTAAVLPELAALRASSRTATTTPTSTTTRSRCSSRRSRCRPTRPPSFGERARPGRARAARRAARRRARPRPRAAPRRAAARRRQARDARPPRRRHADVPRPRPRGRAARPRRPHAAARERAAEDARVRARAPPPAPRLPRPRAPAVAARAVSLPDDVRARRGRRHAAVGRRPPRDARAQGGRVDRQAPRPRARGAAGGARVARRGAPPAARARRRPRRRARARRRPAARPPARGDRRGALRRRGRRRPTRRSRWPACARHASTP